MRLFSHQHCYQPIQNTQRPKLQGSLLRQNLTVIPGPGTNLPKAHLRTGEIPLSSRPSKQTKNGKLNVLSVCDILNTYELQKQRMSSKAKSSENKDPSGARKRQRSSSRGPLADLDLNRMGGTRQQVLSREPSFSSGGAQPGLFRMQSNNNSLDMTRMSSTMSQYNDESVSRSLRF